MFCIECVANYYVCKMNTTNACLYCLSSKLSTCYSMKLFLDYTGEQEELTCSSHPSRVDQTVFQVGAELWLRKTHRPWQISNGTEKTLLAHKAACGNIDLGFRSPLVLLSSPPSAPVPTLWSQFHHAPLSSFYSLTLLHLSLSPFSLDLPCFPSPSSTSLTFVFSNFLRFGWVILLLRLPLCCLTKEPKTPFKELMWHKRIFF